MSTIQFGGVISGLNTQGIIDALVAAKKQPLTDMQTKETNLTSQKAAYTELGTALDDLVTKVKYFTVTAAGARRSADLGGSRFVQIIRRLLHIGPGKPADPFPIRASVRTAPARGRK